jgi:hypothetical protein
MKVKTKNLLENKFVLYLVFFLALVTVFSYIITNNYPPVLLFLLIAILTYYFSKNMIIILGAAIVGTHVVSLINGTNIFTNNLGAKPREGFDGESSGKDGDEAEKTSGGDTATKKPAQRSGFANQTLTPAALNLPNVDNLASKDDAAKKAEKAYDLLESSLGGENEGGADIKNIAGSTKDLLGKQVQLMDQMKQITPILQQTMGLVNNLDLSSLTDMADKVSKLIPEDLGSIAELANTARVGVA